MPEYSRWIYCDHEYKYEDMDISVDDHGTMYTLNSEGDHDMVYHYKGVWMCYHEATGGEIGNKKYCPIHIGMHECSRD